MNQTQRQTQSKSAVTRQRILDAAAREFREQGYAGARLADVARRAGMQTGSLYYHFDSRESLVAEVMRYGITRTHAAVRARLDELGDDATPKARLEAAVTTHLLMLLEHSDYASATIKVSGQVPAEVREAQLQIHQAYAGLWRQLLADARDAGALRPGLDLSIIRMGILGALNWTTEWYRDGGALSPVEVAQTLQAMLLGGIVAE